MGMGEKLIVEDPGVCGPSSKHEGDAINTGTSEVSFTIEGPFRVKRFRGNGKVRASCHCP